MPRHPSGHKIKRLSVYLIEDTDKDIIDAIEGKNVSDFIRMAVRHYLSNKKDDSDSEVLKRLKAIEKKIDKLKEQGLTVNLPQPEQKPEITDEIAQVENSLLDAWK